MNYLLPSQKDWKHTRVCNPVRITEDQCINRESRLDERHESVIHSWGVSGSTAPSDDELDGSWRQSRSSKR
jgi:hypothetical protein